MGVDLSSTGRVAAMGAAPTDRQAPGRVASGIRRRFVPRRALLALTVLLAAAVGGLGAAMHAGDRRSLERDLASQAAQAFAAVTMLVDATLDGNQRLAQILAQDAGVEAFVIAAGRELADGGGTALDRARADLMEHLAPKWAVLRDVESLHSLQVHVGRGLRTVLRADAPERLSQPEYVDRRLPRLVMATGEPRAAFEIGSTAAGLRGIAPVRAGGDTVVGALEVVTVLDPLLDRAHERLGSDFAVLLREEAVLHLATAPASTVEALTIDGTRWRVLATTAPTVRALPLADCACLGTASATVVELADGPVWLAARPLAAVDPGDPVGLIVAWEPIDAEWSAFTERRRDIVAGGAVLFVATWLVAFAVLQLASRQLRATIEQATREVRDLNRALAQKAETDALTGLPNRHAAERLLSALEERPAPWVGETTCVILDLDHFKAINDRFGHVAGDRALVAAATALRSTLRGADRVFRWGGEEFLVVLADGRRAAAHVAERIRGALAATEVAAEAGAFRIAGSIGVAERRRGEPILGCLRRADAALYRAKAAGRNRVVVDGDPA